jgi:hypothetical protein
VDDVPGIDDVRPAPIAAARAARQRHQVRRAEEDLEPVVVDADAQPVADEARGHGAEHLAQHEAAGGGDRHDRLLAVLGAPGRQPPRNDPLGVDTLAVPGVAAADQLVDEAPVVGERVEVARPARGTARPRQRVSGDLAA